jgi:hypothetical protein
VLQRDDFSVIVWRCKCYRASLQLLDVTELRFQCYRVTVYLASPLSSVTPHHPSYAQGIHMVGSHGEGGGGGRLS